MIDTSVFCVLVLHQNFIFSLNAYLSSYREKAINALHELA